MTDLSFYRGKRVFVTGHTGFKGSWLCRILIDAGAEVTGYSLPAPTEPNLFSLAGVEDKMHSVIGDIRDMASLKYAFDDAKPEIVLHLAALMAIWYWSTRLSLISVQRNFMVNTMTVSCGMILTSM